MMIKFVEFEKIIKIERKAKIPVQIEKNPGKFIQKTSEQKYIDNRQMNNSNNNNAYINKYKYKNIIIKII